VFRTDGGFGCQVSGKRNIQAETCWSEAEIPSEAKRQRGTLKPETHDFVSASAFGALLNHHNGNSSVLGPAGRKAVVPYWFDLAAGKSIHAS